MKPNLEGVADVDLYAEGLNHTRPCGGFDSVLLADYVLVYVGISATVAAG